MYFHPRDLTKWLETSLLIFTLGYGCSWAICYWAKQAPNSKMIALKIVKWELIGRIQFCWPCEECQVFLLWANSNGMASNKHGLWLPRQFQIGGWSHFFENEFLQDSENFRGWNLVKWKSWMFTCYRWIRQKSKLFGVTSFKYTQQAYSLWKS